MKISIGVFAYNEENNVARILGQIAAQSLLCAPQVECDVYVLANGCTDRTVAAAESELAKLSPPPTARFVVCDLAFKGKSRTWNHYVHVLTRADVDCHVFMDADIELVEVDTLAKMAALLASPGVQVVNSRPVKDIEHRGGRLGPIDKLILKSGGTLTDYRKSICGQLYMARDSAVRPIHLPIGLPVEDGFVRAMILTSLLTEDEDLERITGDAGIFHVYESIRTIAGLIRHQTRIVIGSSINEALFRVIRRSPAERSARAQLLAAAAADADWLERTIDAELPRWPYGYVSFKFLGKRLRGASNPSRRRLRKMPVLLVGLAFDALVFAVASLKMLKGRGAGYW